MTRDFPSAGVHCQMQQLTSAGFSTLPGSPSWRGAGSRRRRLSGGCLYRLAVPEQWAWTGKGISASSWYWVWQHPEGTCHIEHSIDADGKRILSVTYGTIIEILSVTYRIIKDPITVQEEVIERHLTFINTNVWECLWNLWEQTAKPALLLWKQLEEVIRRALSDMKHISNY